MFIELLIFLISFIVAYIYYIHKKIHGHFEKHGLKYLPGIPVLGNMKKSTFLKRHFLEDIDEVYKAFPDEKYVGLLEGMTYGIVIRDPELIKSITVKDFDHFVDHKPFFPVEIEPLFGGSVLMLTGDKWRDMRTTLSPAFTGSKMRHMMPFMTEISNNIIEYLKEHQTDDTDVGDIIRRYTNDVIASAGFGLQVNSLKDKNNDFYMHGQAMFKFSNFQRFQFLLAQNFPNFTKKLGISLFPKEMTGFFRNIVSSTLDYRKKNNVERPDMIQLLMEATTGTLETDTNTLEKDEVGFAMVNEELKPKGNVRKWTHDELTGQVFIFFVAGFESSATALVMCIHELAINPDVQEKLYQEVKSFRDNNPNLNYDNISELKYLDCVMNETFRKWSPAIFLDRVCTKAYELPPPNKSGKPYKLKPGDVVYNMVNVIHMDPQYFPNPEKFDPERFSEENKHKIKPFTFMPFGVGPRNCIGSRFALLELKVLLYNMILNFKIQKCKRTADPMRLEPGDFNIRAQGGTYVKLEHRN